MKDLGLDTDKFDLDFGHRNDLVLKEGQAEFEQYLANALTTEYYDEIGSTKSGDVRSRLQLEAERVVRNSERVDSIRSITVKRSEESPNTYEVHIIYLSDEVSTFNIN